MSYQPGDYDGENGLYMRDCGGCGGEVLETYPGILCAEAGCKTLGCSGCMKKCDGCESWVCAGHAVVADDLAFCVRCMKTAVYRCAGCGAAVASTAIELDAKERIVCSSCYLADPPADDIDATLLGIELVTEEVA
ncbi:hypothetical protein UFOVP130_69 [uncultured Caudovirales phage]|uniref:Uncharacterized protein n=1 Tax=uncultured Caudovirales phage TaxID=2100421 RepID=A0A6J5L9A4_9CAUD|nr:hypothetical protein UFOVP130_69 [uncultured Caudovirales phage]